MQGSRGDDGISCLQALQYLYFRFRTDSRSNLYRLGFSRLIEEYLVFSHFRYNGFIGYNYLGVREYPSVDNPIISVSCSYPGANADVIENQITEPLEQNINGIPGIRSLSSVIQQGSSRITVEFELSVDLETAANDVRDKVSRAQRYLPRDCDPPTVSKAAWNSAFLPRCLHYLHLK